MPSAPQKDEHGEGCSAPVVQLRQGLSVARLHGLKLRRVDAPSQALAAVHIKRREICGGATKKRAERRRGRRAQSTRRDAPLLNTSASSAAFSAALSPGASRVCSRNSCCASAISRHTASCMPAPTTASCQTDLLRQLQPHKPEQRLQARRQRERGQAVADRRHHRRCACVPCVARPARRVGPATAAAARAPVRWRRHTSFAPSVRRSGKAVGACGGTPWIRRVASRRVAARRSRDGLP